MPDENKTEDITPQMPKADVVSADPTPPEPQAPTSPTPSAKTVDPIAAAPTPQDPSSSSSLEDSGSITGTYAGFWIRFLAAIIDSFILGIFGAIIMAIFGGILGTALVSQPAEPSVASAGLLAGLFGSMQLVVIAINLGYYVVLTGLYGATIGKMILGLRVVNTEGQKISFGKAALREIIGKWISGLVFGLGYLWVAFDEKKQGWHDKIASTYVVKIR